MAPEIFRGDEDSTYGFEVDMWAFGVLFFFMLNSEFPFSTFPFTQR
jgi:serine/threonine protein kinase